MLRWRVPLGFLFAAWYLLIARPVSMAAFALCGVLVTLGCLVRSWAAGYLLKGKRLAVGGPYAYVRNPLYGGSFIIGTGFCAALWQWPVPIGSGVMMLAFVLGFGVMYRGKVLDEEKELASGLGEVYQAYARQVPAFLPVRGRAKGLGDQRFSGELYRRNREYECVAGCAVLLLYLYVRYAIGS